MCTPETTERGVIRSPLRSRPFVLLLLAAGGMFFGFALLVSVVPLWVVEHGSGEFSAGAVTGVFMTSTVLAQLMMSTLVRRFGYRAMAITGAALLGAPASLLMLFTDWQPVLVVSFVRGIGFGIVTVCGSALIAELLPRGMLAKGSGVFGLAVGLPLLVGLPAGAWLAQNVGFVVVFLAGAALPMLGIVPLTLLPRTTAQPEEDGRGTMPAARAVWRPWLVMLSGSVAFGALVTFLPLVFVESPLAGSMALLLMSATALVGRWLAGIWGDSVRPTGKLLVAGLAATSTGLLGLAVGAGATGTAALVLGVSCVAVYGAGFGVIQNDALVVMFARVSAARASVAWNIAFDAGQGAGAAVVGAVVTLTGFPVAFAMLAVLAIVLVPVAWPRARHAVR